LLQPFLRYSAYIERALRSEYFSEVLCEKRAEKQNKCKGKCAVQKKIKQAEKKENALPVAKKVSETEYLLFHFFSFSPADKHSTLIFPDAFQSAISVTEISYDFRYFSAVFHPPAL
jgi:predicted Holliday junction resolvase-like endonuclease